MVRSLYFTFGKYWGILILEVNADSCQHSGGRIVREYETAQEAAEVFCRNGFVWTMLQSWKNVNMRNNKIQDIYWKQTCQNIVLDQTSDVKEKQEWRMCLIWSEPKILAPFTEVGKIEVREYLCGIRQLNGDVEQAIRYTSKEV